MNRDEYYAALNAHRAYVEEHKDELMHHGIKGQKWGLRRFQNPDGTLTPAGRDRYLKALNTVSTYQTRNVGKATAQAAALGAGLSGGLTTAKTGSISAGLLSGTIGAATSAALTATLNSSLNAIDRSKFKKAEAILQQFKDMYGDKSVEEVTKDLKLEKKMEDVTKSKDFWPNERKYDLEFLEKMDNPTHVDHLSDGSLDRLWMMKKAGASWDQMYAEKDRLERLEAKMNK